MGQIRDISAELLVMAILGVLFGLLGPFGTFAMPIALRVGVWLVMAIGGYACFRPVIAAGRTLSERSHMPLTLAMALACVVASVPVTVLIGGLLGQGLDPAALAHSYPYVLLVGSLATAIQFFLFSRREALAGTLPSPAASPPAAALGTNPPHTSPPPSPPAAPPFLDRLPPHLGRDLLCLEMEDHYVRAHTPGGSTLILMRMRDAVGELAGIEGERVHRSWWVARAAVAGTERRDRATILRLSNGLDVPVARDSVALLRSRGWL